MRHTSASMLAHLVVLYYAMAAPLT